MSTIEPSNALDHTLLQIQNCGHKVDSVTWKNRLVTRFKLDQDDQDLLDSASFARRLGWNCPDCNAPIDKFFHPAKDRVDQINMVAPVLSKERVFIEAQDLILNKNCLGLNQEELEYCREVADRLPKGEDPRTQRDSFELWWEVIPQGSIVPREFNTALKNLLKNLEEAESRRDKYWIKTHKDHLEECIAETVQHWYNPDLPYRIALYRLGGMQDSENDLWNSLKELKEICPFHSLVDRLFEKLRHHVASLSHCFLGSSAEIGKLFKHYPNLHHIEPRFTTEEAFYAFLDILRSGASPLTSIKFPYSGVSHEREEMAAIIDALRENTTIRK
ncbi:MAG: hypothetical protein KDK78_07610, partial [Chlamydiia bacterium]|nr:hypothetical protein [Chlamydiia bacterium]